MTPLLSSTPGFPRGQKVYRAEVLMWQRLGITVTASLREREGGRVVSTVSDMLGGPIKGHPGPVYNCCLNFL